MIIYKSPSAILLPSLFRLVLSSAQRAVPRRARHEAVAAIRGPGEDAEEKAKKRSLSVIVKP